MNKLLMIIELLLITMNLLFIVILNTKMKCTNYIDKISINDNAKSLSYESKDDYKVSPCNIYFYKIEIRDG